MIDKIYLFKPKEGTSEISSGINNFFHGVVYHVVSPSRMASSNTLDLYFGVTVFESRLGHILSSLKFFWF